MQLRFNDLNRHLAGQLAPSYFVSGDEPLQLQEATDQIRAAARAAGCHERERIAINEKEDWLQLAQSSASLSLFAERKLIEIHVPNGKPGSEGSKALQQYLASGSDDILLVVSGKLDKSSARAKWFTALDQHGVVMQVWPISPQEMPGWIGARLQAAGLHADRAAIQLLSERVEGNLLAAVQEIEKLKLLAGDAPLNPERIQELVLGSARYNPFDLIDVALAGNSQHALRSARGLRAEGTAPPALLWVLQRELRLLSDLHQQGQRGVSIDQAMQQAGVWKKRMRLIKTAVQRHSATTLDQLAAIALQIDATSKGFARGNPWDAIDRFLLLLAEGQQRQRATSLG